MSRVIRRIPSRARSRSRGQMSIEFAIVIALASLVLGGIIYYVFVGRNGTKVNDAVASLTTMVSNAETLYSRNSAGFNGVSDDVLINNGAVPKTMQQGTTISNQFGGAVTVASTNLYGTDDGLSITYAAVPPDSCSDFVQRIQSSFKQITVGSTSVKDVTTGANALDIPTLGTACNTGGNVDLTLVAGR